MNLLFDLDGTLTDPGVGIARCIQHALAGMGRPVPPTDDLHRFVGPPLHGSFEELLGTRNRAQVEEAIRLYRSRFATVGMFENHLYPDVRDVLSKLKAAGQRLWVVTSKPHAFARPIIEHFQLTSFFQEILGSELSGENADKADLIRIAVEKEALVVEETWMIGDRAQDILGARKNGVRAVAALWGYGTADELRSAKPDWMAQSMAELRRWAG